MARNKMEQEFLDSSEAFSEIWDQIVLKERYGRQRQLIQKSAHELQAYRSSLENLISEGKALELADLKRQFPPEEHEEYWHNFYPTNWEEIHQRNFRMSLAIMSITFLEHYLNQICNDAKRISQTPISWKDIKGSSTLSQFQKYLNTLLGFTKPQESAWEDLKTVYKIRNALVHAFGTVDDDTEILRKSEKIPGIKIASPNYDMFSGAVQSNSLIHLSPDFNIYLIDIVAKLLDDCCLEMANLCEKYDTNKSCN